MTDYICNCNSWDLMHHGCRCKTHKPRTLPITITVPEVGLTEAWHIVRLELNTLSSYRTSHIKEPENIQDLMWIIWWLEVEDPTAYEYVARAMEERMKNYPSNCI